MMAGNILPPVVPLCFLLWRNPFVKMADTTAVVPWRGGGDDAAGGGEVAAAEGTAGHCFPRIRQHDNRSLLAAALCVNRETVVRHLLR